LRGYVHERTRASRITCDFEGEWES
jgi:hypothetical protein